MIRYLPVILLLCLLLQGCKYTLSGYNITGNTAEVHYFENQAPIQSADLSQIFTTKLEQKITRETPLQLVQNNGDVVFSGAIIGYTLQPAAVSGVDQTEQTELRITVQVLYENKKEEKEEDKQFQENFSASQTFNSDSDLSAIESQLFDEISDQLVQSIFNRAFIDW